MINDKDIVYTIMKIIVSLCANGTDIMALQACIPVYITIFMLQQVQQHKEDLVIQQQRYSLKAL